MSLRVFATLYVVWLQLYTSVEAQFSNVGADACSQIIKAGIYNTIQSSSAQTSYSQFQSTMCSDLSSYTYDVYSSQKASKQADSLAVNVDVSASYLGFDGSVGVGTSSASLTEDQFNQFKSAQNAYRQRVCGSSSSSDGFSNDVRTLSNIIDPSVSASYTSCLKVYATGIQMTQTTGVDVRSFALDIQFVTNNLGAVAYMTGIATNGPATCTVQGPSLSGDKSCSFKVKLVPDAVYTVICQLPPSVPANGGITDIYVSTTPGGTYHGLLFHSTPVNQLTAIRSQISTLQPQIKTLNSELSSSSEQISTLQSQIATLQSQVNTLQSNAVLPMITIGPLTYAITSSGGGGLGHDYMLWDNAIETAGQTMGWVAPYSGYISSFSSASYGDISGTFRIDAYINRNSVAFFSSGDFAATGDYSNTYPPNTFIFKANDLIQFSIFPTLGQHYARVVIWFTAKLNA